MWIVFLDIPSTFERAFHAAHELGLKILWIGEGTSVPHLISILADKYIVINKYDFDSISEVALKQIDPHEINAFWALKDKHIPLASKLTIELGHNYKYPNENVVLNTKNKIALRETLKSTNYNPDFAVINPQFVTQNPFSNQSVVIKPPLGYSSIGVEKVMNDQDFESALLRSQSVLKKVADSVNEHKVSSFDPLNCLLVEKFISGAEYSVEVFVNSDGIHCLGICGKSEMKAPFFEEISYCLPACIDANLSKRIYSAALEITKAIQLDSGMAHIELKVNQNEIKVLDIGLRLGGSGLTHDLIQLSSGIDIVKAVLAEIVNMSSSEILKESNQSVALLYLIQVEEGGILARLPNPTVTLLNKKLPEFKRKEIFVNVNEKLIGYPNYSGLPGFVLYQINNRSSDSFRRAEDLVNLSKNIFKLEYL